MKKSTLIHTGESILSLWIIYIFLGSLPYKFSNSDETQFIFGTIGAWLEGLMGQTIGQGFANYGGYVIGILELIISIMLIIAIYSLVKKRYSKAGLLFGVGGLGAMVLMIGAVFFHLFTPLGIEVNDDGGSLFKAAVSIIFIGASLAAYNGVHILKK